MCVRAQPRPSQTILIFGLPVGAAGKAADELGLDECEYIDAVHDQEALDVRTSATGS